MGDSAIAERIALANGYLSPQGFTFGGADLKTLVGSGTEPFYAYDAGVLKARIDQVTRALGRRVDVLYSAKANPNLALLQIMLGKDLGIEVASEGELLVALSAGANPNKIQYAGPGKTLAEITQALRNGIGAINVESEAELETIVECARREESVAKIALRIQIQALKGSRMRMVGGSQQFGMTVDTAADLLPGILNNRSLELKGLHTYGGTQCFDSDAWVANAYELKNIAHQLEQESGYNLRSLNFGGGFGVEYFEGDEPFDLKAAGRGIQDLIAEDDRDDRAYHVELGRYLVATCGAYFTQILYVKEVGDVKHLILNGGMHHHAAAAGIGSVIKRPFPLLNVSRTSEELSSDVHVCGSLCTPADSFGRAELTESKAGDWIAVLNSGAYGYTFSPLNFLSHVKPAEYLVENRQLIKIRDGTSPSDVLSGQHRISPH